MTVKRTPLQSIVLYRDGKTFTPPIGEVFEFTQAEADEIERVNPDALSSQATVSVDDVADKAVAKKGDKAAAAKAAPGKDESAL